MEQAALTTRTCYSLLEGASQPEVLLRAAQVAGITRVGVVDRDAVYGLPQAHKAAAALGVGLVCGATLTVAGAPPVVLWAANHEGWSNLCALITASREDQAKGWSWLDPKALAARAGGLYAALSLGWEPAQAAPLREAFGERLSVWLSRQATPADRVRTREAFALSEALSCPVLASQDVLYADAAGREVADVLACVRRRTTLAEAGRWLMANGEQVILDGRRFAQRYGDLPQAVARAVEVADACTFSLAQLRYRYPPEVVPEGFTAIGWLRELTEQGAVKRWPGGLPEAVRVQIEHELAVIEQLDFPAYFLTVFDAVSFARSRGILCQGRGSAANSAVCYALGITAVDPTRSKLLFERFISPERNEPPDIDVDFEHERREEVIQYLYQRYGRHRAAMVNEIIAWRGRSAVRDVGRVVGLSLDQIDRLARATDRWSAGVDATPDSLVREAGLDPRAPEVQRTLALAERLAGLPRHVGIHVGGFVIAEGPLSDLVPIEPATMDGRTVIQWDKYDVEILGFVKVDVLALGMLSAIRRSFDLVKAAYGRALGLASVPAEDTAVYDQFCQGDTIGVFQIESRAQQSMLPRLRPRCFYDLVVEVAIVRPGPIQGGMVHPYLRRRSGEEAVDYAHPALEPILERTLGVPLFQEQVMAMAVAVGGFTPGEADQLRRAMGAWRKRGGLNGFGEKLITGMGERGIPAAYAEQIFAQIQGFGEYGFPESHASSFALLVYVSGWLKCHYPEAFTAGLINSQPMGFYSPRALVADARRHGVEVLPVCVKSSEWDCTLERVGQAPRRAIRLGMRLIQGMRTEEVAGLVSARAQRPFSGLADLARRAGLSQVALTRLAEADALAGLVPDRRQAAWQIQSLRPELPLLAWLSPDTEHAPLPALTETEALLADYRTVGLAIDRHPMQLVRAGLPEGTLSLSAAQGCAAGKRVRIAGMVQSRQRPSTAKGVVFMTLEDEGGTLNLVVWPKVWAEFRVLARGATLIGVDGTLQREREAVSVLVTAFWAVDPPVDRQVDGKQSSFTVASRDFH